uniref:Glycoside hydrolase family 28 n=1 Tax=Aretaon asperrimus TaxID=173775 RepID=A0A191XSV0_9NEOP|nr:glycoside hydrolase family 28 [Aretaon asperrimus]
MFKISVVVLVLAILREAAAKDLRTVTEPKIPASCVSLKGSGGDETAVIQKALNSCSGKVVHLASGTFVSGPLTIPSGVGLWVDSGVVLKATTNPKLYDTGENACGTLSKKTYSSCKPLIHISGATGSGVYGKGTIDGQGGATITGKGITWWQLSREGQVKNEYQNNPSLIIIDGSRDITLYQITLKNSPGSHVGFKKTYGFTAWGVTIDTPANARNTDGFDPSSSENATITHCSISAGDDNVAIKAHSGPSRYMSITNSHFGSGHGMSIGSETNSGVSDVTVSNVSFKGTLNGLQIKSDRSRGGLVTGITYSDVCMQDVDNPIRLNTEYSATATGNSIPEYKGITFNNIKVLTAGTFTFDGFSDEKPIQATLNNVHIKKGSKFIEKHVKLSGKFEEDASGNSC